MYQIHLFLSLADTEAPGLIEGFYMVGSLAQNDYRPGRSDLDFVAVTQNPLTASEWAAIERAHRKLMVEQPRPWLSGIYVTWGDLMRNPLTITDAAFHHEGKFGVGRAFEANPAVWQILKDHGVCFRGPAYPDVWTDSEVLRAWSLENLDTYWRGWIERRRRLAGVGVTLLSGQVIEWCVAGVARVHHAIVLGQVTSKTEAIEGALQRFSPQHSPILQEALRLRCRRSGAGMNPFTRRAAAIAFADAVIRGQRDVT